MILLGFLRAVEEARRPLGLTVVGGLLISQPITLLFTAVRYTYFDSLQEKIKSSPVAAGRPPKAPTPKSVLAAQLSNSTAK